MSAKDEGVEPKRRLATVLSADVEGFSRLCAVAEAETLAMLDWHLKEIIGPTVRQYKGRVANIAGDGVIAEFGSAVAAVNAALAIQRTVAARNADVPSDRQLRFRIGLNLSEVVVSKRQIFGDGVNVAARAQSFAEAGAICATEAVVLQVRGKIHAEFADIGLVRLKNIAEPVHLFRIGESAVGGDAASMGVELTAAPVASSKPSIAVLPFLNLSGDPDQSYFSDGITEDLITDLSRFRTISVIARNSSFVYRGRSVDVRQVADDLGVRFVVEGSVRKLQNSVRITVQLVNAETRAHVWAERYDVPLERIFETQDEIIRSVVGRLVPRLEDETLAIARRKPTEMLEAYEHYLRGKAVIYAATDASGVVEARKHFEKAIAIDPQFAAPYCYLVRILNNVTEFTSPGEPVAPYRSEAWRLAKIAVSLDDSEPHAHLVLAWCHLWRGEFENARRHLETAERLNPNDPDRAMDCGTGWLYLGEIDRAIACMMRGIESSPHCPDLYLADLAEAYFLAGRYEEMLEVIERIPDLSLLMPAWRAAGYALAGDLPKAAAQAGRFAEGVSAVWAGASGAGPADYVAWMMSLSPFRRPEDRERLLSGLRLAGLPDAAVSNRAGIVYDGAGRPA